MTVLTIQWACQNRPKIDKSDELSGSTCCATSAGFMAFPFGLPGSVATTGAAPGHPTKAHTQCGTRKRADLPHVFARSLPAAAGRVRNPVKFDQTRAPDRSFRL